MKILLKITAVLLFSSTLVATAQDKVYKRNGEVLETKVVEIGETEIKYKVFANLDGPNYVLAKNLVLKITYQNGTTETFVNATNTIRNVELKRAQNIFIELGAQGLFLTANYDTRFGKTRNGLGGRIGIGALGDSGVNEVTVPVGLNYLLGQGKNFFEIGLGATYASLGPNNGGRLGTGNTVIGTLCFMYRLQPTTNGFSFRGGLTPIFTTEGFFSEYAGISLGYSF